MFMVFVFLMIRLPARATRTSTLLPYTTLFLSVCQLVLGGVYSGLSVDLLAVQHYRLVALDAQVHAVGHLLAVERHRRDLVHGDAGLGGIPERAHPDLAGLEIGDGDRQQAGADDRDLAGQARILECQRGADDDLARADLDVL